LGYVAFSRSAIYPAAVSLLVFIPPSFFIQPIIERSLNSRAALPTFWYIISLAMSGDPSARCNWHFPFCAVISCLLNLFSFARLLFLTVLFFPFLGLVYRQDQSGFQVYKARVLPPFPRFTRTIRSPSTETTLRSETEGSAFSVSPLPPF